MSVRVFELDAKIAAHGERLIALALPAILAFATCGCSRSAWSGRVEHWGELREVMRDGKTEPRVRLRDVLARPHCYAIGALQGLDGEVTVLDGTAWISRVTQPGCVTSVERRCPPEQATILVAAWVPQWRDSRIERDVPRGEFDQFVRESAPVNAGATFPFVIEGEFDGLRVHVVNGRCLMGAADDADDGSFRREVPAGRGTLVGFFTNEPAGVITHQGSQTHVHVLLAGDEPLMAHVEAVGVRHGGVIRFPIISDGAPGEQ